ncbi:MAG: competence/damage-inducible protein A [Phycisphaerae bacterium]
MIANILAVGDELVSGQTVDSNSAYLARQLALLGIPTPRHETVADDLDALTAAFARAADLADVVLVTGGLGPTVDDLTRQALANALDEDLRLDEDRLREIEAFFTRHGRQMANANKTQAMVPVSAEAIPNRVGTAPGIAAELNGSRVFVMPGVPHEMREMFAHSVAPRLQGGSGVIVHRLLHTFGTGESDLGQKIGDLMKRGRNPAIGTTAKAGQVGIRIVARAETREEAERMITSDRVELEQRLGGLIIGADGDTMASVLGESLRNAGQTLAAAESCTGGLIGKEMTDVAGASDYFLGGVIAYSNEIKQKVLGVELGLLVDHGAVSEPVARAMAEGVRRRFDSDWGIGVTGIAGPGGGSEEKPVGTVYIGIAGPGGTQVHRHVFPGDREFVRARTALAALNYVRTAVDTEGP